MSNKKKDCLQRKLAAIFWPINPFALLSYTLYLPLPLLVVYTVVICSFD
jgi:hypothetical protein